jgi:hypothetical protein
MQDAIAPQYAGADDKIQVHIIQTYNQSDQAGYSECCYVDSRIIDSQQPHVDGGHRTKSNPCSVCEQVNRVTIRHESAWIHWVPRCQQCQRNYPVSPDRYFCRTEIVLQDDCFPYPETGNSTNNTKNHHLRATRSNLLILSLFSSMMLHPSFTIYRPLFVPIHP